MAIIRVYGVLVDPILQRVALNMKDATLPEAILLKYEGLIGLFGGAMKEGETPEEGLKRELDEELPGFLNLEEVQSAKPCFENEHGMVFAIVTSLAGDRYNRLQSRIGELARCTEGDGIVRTYEFVRRASEEFFVHPSLQEAVLAAIASMAE